MMIKCPSCGEEVEQNAEHCPSCMLPAKAFEILARERKKELTPVPPTRDKPVTPKPPPQAPVPKAPTPPPQTPEPQERTPQAPIPQKPIPQESAPQAPLTQKQPPKEPLPKAPTPKAPTPKAPVSRTKAQTRSFKPTHAPSMEPDVPSTGKQGISLDDESPDLSGSAPSPIDGEPVANESFETVTLDHDVVAQSKKVRKGQQFNFKDIPDHSVLPAEVPEEVYAAVLQAMDAKALTGIYTWITQNLKEDGDVYDLLELYLKRYEERVMQVMGEQLKDHEPVLNTAILLKCWELLPSARKGFADRGVNPTFMETWLKKHILALLVDRSLTDIELALELYRERSSYFLDDKINLLLPQTCLKKIGVPDDKKTPLPKER